MVMEGEFPEEYLPLLKAVCSAVTRKSESRKFAGHGAATPSDLEEREYLVSALYRRLDPKEKKRYIGELQDKGISPSGLKKERTAGFSNADDGSMSATERAEQAFYISARHHKKQPLEHLLNILKDAEGEGRKLRGTVGHEETVAKLLSEPTTRRTSVTYDSGVLSDRLFSDGLREALKRFNAELNFLTVEQVRALEAVNKYRNLWIQGGAGSGKTIFAIEVAYRALRAGLSVLMVYRSSQFKKIFSESLDKFGEQLTLMLHSDFVLLLSARSQYKTTSKIGVEIFRNFFPSAVLNREPWFDLLIVDDCGTYTAKVSFLVRHAESIAYRKIFLIAPDQIFGYFMGDAYFYGDVRKEDHSNDDICDVASQCLRVPKNYVPVSLGRNIRNARTIVKYMNSVFHQNYLAGIDESGTTNTVNVSQEELGSTLLSLCAELLGHYPPERIKILVEPDLSFLVNERDEGNGIRLNDRLWVSGLATAIYMASETRDNYGHATLEYNEAKVKTLYSEIAGNRSCFVCAAADGPYVLTERSLEKVPQAKQFLLNFEQWPMPHVDAKTILSPEVLSDPLKIPGAILICPVQQFIGLESDAVIYVRNEEIDLEKKWSVYPPEILDWKKKVRNFHHVVGMSRAKYHLIDFIVS